MKIVFAWIFACSLLAGCVPLIAGGAGAGAVAFAKGEYVTSYERGYEQTWQAAADTMKEEGISLNNTSKEGGLMEGTRENGQDLKLVLQNIKPDTTEIRIRVGNLGDEEYSRLLDRKIQQRLGLV